MNKEQATHNIPVTDKPTMKLFTALLTLGAATLSTAWTTASTSNSIHRSHSVALGMGSRAADKASTRKEWAEKRGMAEGDDNSSSGLCTIIGGGRIGSLLETGGESILLKRGDSISPENEGTPILIATRNDSLDKIIDECPENRLKDLVFLQNGYLDGFLEKKGLADNSQALLFFSVPALGVEPVDGVTRVNPEGLTAVTGVHSQVSISFHESFYDIMIVLSSKHMQCTLDNNSTHISN